MKKFLLDPQTGKAIAHVRWCDSFASKLRGFMFRSKLGLQEGLVLVEKKPSIAGTAIHMFFVFTPLAVIWLDEDNIVRHTVMALPWRPFYGPKVPCKYVVELHPSLVLHFEPGHRIEFSNEA